MKHKIMTLKYSIKWNIQKKNDQLIFTKNHEGKKEVFLDEYLKRFMVENLNIDSIK